MRLLLHTLVFWRYLQLNRQAREIRRRLERLPNSTRRAVGKLAMNELEVAARTRNPQLHGSSSPDVLQPWGDGASLAFRRARARVSQLQHRGLAMWLAIVYHETLDSPHASMQELHREVLGLLGLAKGTYDKLDPRTVGTLR